MAEQMKPNRLRQCDNLSKYTGPFKGKYYRDGIYQPPKEIRITMNLPLSGTIFKWQSRK